MPFRKPTTLDMITLDLNLPTLDGMLVGRDPQSFKYCADYHADS